MKRIIAIFAIAIGSFSANAAFLYWQIEDTQPYREWDTANLYVRNDKSVKIGEIRQSVEGDGGSTDAMSFDLSGIQNVEQYSFYIELVNSTTSELQGYTASNETYANLVARKSIVDTEMEISQVNLWHGGAFAAPEPTSGVLMLLGVAGLALRRKQRKSE